MNSLYAAAHCRRRQVDNVYESRRKLAYSLDRTVWQLKNNVDRKAEKMCTIP